jgi:hypothetical protein
MERGPVEVVGVRPGLLGTIAEYEQGALTDDEFQAAKRQLLG